MARAEILAQIEAHALHEGLTPTPFEGVRLFRASAPFPQMPAVYSPSVCVVVQGAKKAHFDGEVYVYDAEHYLCVTMPIPVLASIEDASVEEPALGLWIDLESRVMTELMLDVQRSAEYTGTRGGEGKLNVGMSLGIWDETFERALWNMLSLLDAEAMTTEVLGPGRLRELLFSLVSGPVGYTIHERFGSSRRLGHVIDYVYKHLNEDLSIEALALRAGMSRPVFDRAFRQTTTFSPLQFIKTLRLTTASTLIAQGLGIGEAADQVGNTNRSQFAREFRRQFGMSPREWRRDARSSGLTVPELGSQRANAETKPR